MTRSTKVKICGITSTADAKLASDLGADYLGLIFVDSPRKIDIALAREIRRAEHRALLVGVFKDAPRGEVIETVRAAKLDLIQLHGDESPEYCDDVLARTGQPIIKAFKASNLPDVRELSRYRTAGFFMFDIDKRMVENPPSEDFVHRMWDIAARKRRKGFRIFLAGALDKDNVREAIRRTNAYGVDVCRGVEESPGVKDPVELERFIEEVRR
jgi:phosphoribosylanthranilate isomerase